MSILHLSIVYGSILCIVVLSIYKFARKQYNIKMLLIICLILIFYSIFLIKLFGINANIVSKSGSSGELIFTLTLYISMLLGMLSQYIYTILSVPQVNRQKFDLGLFVSPIFTSPIVFIPLFAAFQNASIDINDSTVAKAMIYLVAFENGFFWRDFFVNKLKEKIK